MSTRFVVLGAVPTWHERANCDGLGDVMYPDKGDHGTAAWAKRVCAGCDVRQECLTDHLNRGDYWGIAGGLTGKERRRLAQQEQASKQVTAA